MKTRFFAVILVCAAAAGLVWYITAGSTQPETKPAAASAPALKTAATPAVIDQPKVAAPARVAAPVQPAAPKPVASAPSATAAAKPAFDVANPQPQADLKNCIAQSLALLETRDIVGILKTLMPPDAMQQMIASGRVSSVEDIAAMYRQRPDFEEKLTQMQQMLDAIKDQTPDISADGQTATYHVDPGVVNPVNDKGNATFIQVNGYWYLK
jgi:hypothetical protein